MEEDYLDFKTEWRSFIGDFQTQSNAIMLQPRVGGLGGWASGCYAGDRVITQGLKITEEKVRGCLAVIRCLLYFAFVLKEVFAAPFLHPGVSTADLFCAASIMAWATDTSLKSLFFMAGGNFTFASLKIAFLTSMLPCCAVSCFSNAFSLLWKSFLWLVVVSVPPLVVIVLSVEQAVSGLLPSPSALCQGA